MSKPIDHILPAGTLLHGRYRILAYLDQGGFGITYKAEDERLAKSVCIKELFIQGHCTRGAGNSVQTQGLKDLNFADFRERFMKEARRLARFKNPGIVEVLDVFEEYDTAYYCMEFIEGEPLSKLIERKGKLSVKEALDIFLPLLDAVEVLHEANPPLLHRDIKPSNIMLRKGLPVLIDFGTAREYNNEVSRMQSRIYTEGYSPYELISEWGKDGPFSDVYSLGATLYTMFIGKKPNAAGDRQAGYKLPSPSALNPDVPNPLSAVILKAMQLKAEDRYQTVSALRTALQAQISDPLKDAHLALKTLQDQTKTLAGIKNSAAAAEKLLKRYGGREGDKWQAWRKEAKTFVYASYLSAADSAFTEKRFAESKKLYERTLEYNPDCSQSQNRLELIRDLNSNSSRFNWKGLILTLVTILLILGMFLWYRFYYVNSVDFDNAYSSAEASEEQTEVIVNEFSPIIQGLLDHMQYIEGGIYTMGCHSGQDNDCDADEKPVHAVTLSSFKIGKYEVTQEEWEAVMGSNPSEHKNCPKCPVENVSWNDVQKFLYELNKVTNGKFRLPTEAEWEYAARGGSRPDGTIYSGSDDIENVAWDYSNGSTNEVGKLNPNGQGLHDMSGNVWEWCSDWYANYNKSAQTNPVGPPETRMDRVLRGGGWDYGPKNCRVTNRNYYPQDTRASYFGFRLVQPIF